MKVYVTGKVEGYTKTTLKDYIESKGHEFKSLNKATELLVIAERPGAKRIATAKSDGIPTMSWDEFEKTHLK
ncbi:MAG: BRCT domain-containing protein [Candidatus Thorarchaeota archaeon]